MDFPYCKKYSVKDKKLVIIADDFGFSQGVNLGVVTLWQKNLIGGVSISANFPGFSQAVKLGRKEKMEIGFHLNLTQGKPILPVRKVRSLVGKNGEFLGKEMFFLKTILGKINYEEVAQETRAQIKKIKSFGIEPIFANGHQNVQLFPGIFRIFLEEVSIAKISFVRNPLDAGLKSLRGWHIKPQRKILLFILGRIARKKIVSSDLKFPGQSFSLSLKKEFNINQLLDFVGSLRGRTIEMTVHPGYQEPLPPAFKTYLLKQRERELEFLLESDLARNVRRRGYNLTCFSKL